MTTIRMMMTLVTMLSLKTCKINTSKSECESQWKSSKSFIIKPESCR